MITANTNLINLLNTSEVFYMADLFIFELTNGTILRYTSHDQDISYGGNTYLCDSLLIKRDRVRLCTGVEVDELNLTVNYDDSEIIANNMTFPVMIHKGIFDTAKFTMYRAFFNNWGEITPVGVIKRFAGKVADATVTHKEGKLTIASALEILNVKMPKNLVQASCSRVLYTEPCGVIKENFKYDYTALAGSTNSKLTVSALSGGAGWGNLGTLICVTGANAGIKRTIKAYAGTSITTILPFPNAIQEGDTFTAYAGCDGTYETCKNKFNNLQHFRGYPFVPQPEVVY